MHQCVAFKCKNRGIHVFPRKVELRELWILAVRIQKPNFTPSKNSRLCSDHFKPEDYAVEGYDSGIILTRKILKRGTVPSWFPWIQQETKKKRKRAKKPQEKQIKIQQPKPEKKALAVENVTIPSNECSIDINCFLEVEIDEKISDPLVLPNEKVFTQESSFNVLSKDIET